MAFCYSIEAVAGQFDLFENESIKNLVSGFCEKNICSLRKKQFNYFAKGE